VSGGGGDNGGEGFLAGKSMERAGWGSEVGGGNDGNELRGGEDCPSQTA